MIVALKLHFFSCKSNPRSRNVCLKMSKQHKINHTTSLQPSTPLTAPFTHTPSLTPPPHTITHTTTHNITLTIMHIITHTIMHIITHTIMHITSVCTRSVKLKLSKYRAKYVANGFEIQSNYRAKANNFPKNTTSRKCENDLITGILQNFLKQYSKNINVNNLVHFYFILIIFALIYYFHSIFT